MANTEKATSVAHTKPHLKTLLVVFPARRRLSKATFEALFKRVSAALEQRSSSARASLEFPLWIKRQQRPPAAVRGEQRRH